MKEKFFSFIQPENYLVIDQRLKVMPLNTIMDLGWTAGQLSPYTVSG